jgi:hypothetical protein
MFEKASIVLVLVPALWAGNVVSAQPAAAEPQQRMFTFRYVKPTSPEFDSLFTSLRESRILEVWTDYVGTSLRTLPIKMEVAFTECGKADSWYEPSQSVIILCYEEIHQIYATLMSIGLQDDRLLVAWIGTILGELYHELAHGLMHNLMLPIAGGEEDAADEFAVLALLKHPRGEDLVLGSVDYFESMARVEKDAGYDLSQRHSLVGQRYFNMLCWTYGSDPSAHRSLVEQGRLPKARAETCRAEYLRVAYAWDALLKPFVR